MRHAEALLLVDDQQAEIMELHVLLQQLMRADDEIERTGTQVGHVFLDLCRGAEARQHADLHREAPEAVDRRRIMLLRQHGRRHKNGDLLAVEDRLHGRAQRDLGLAEADVAAEQAIHRLGRLHIGFDLLDAAELIVRLGIGEILLEFRLPRAVGRKGEAHAPLALGVELDEVDRQLLGRCLGAGLGLLPGVAAELVEPHGRLLAAADVFGDQVELCRRNIEHIRALIGDLDIVLDRAVDLHLLHADIAADAVVFVYDEVARRKVGKGVELLPIGRLGLVPAGLGLLRRDELSLGQNGQMQIGVFHAEGQRPVRQQDLPGPRQLLQREGQKRAQPLFAEHLRQDLPASAVAAEHERGKVVFLIKAQVGHGGVQIAAVARKLLGRHVHEQPRLQTARIGRSQERVEKDRPVAAQTVANILPAAGKFAQLAAQQAGLQQAVELHPLLLGEAVGRAAQIAVVAEIDRRIRRQIVRCAGEFRIDQRHIAVGRREAHAALKRLGVLGQRFDERLVRRAAAPLPRDQAAQLVGQPLRALRMQPGQRLCNGQQHGALRVLHAALADRIKEAHRVDLVAEELDAHRLLMRRGINVDDAATHGELPHALDERAAAVARLRQAEDQLLGRDRRVGCDGQGAGAQQLRRHRAQAERLPSRDDSRRRGQKRIEQLQAALLPPARDR